MTGPLRRGEASITVCPDGPLLVRGAVRLEDAEGTEVDHDRNVIALCRCGRSARKPLCDGSHRGSRFRDPADADGIAAALAQPGGPADDPH
ncbi:CDGSH-type Zn-finger protein [Friedmanniella endophytica]|uniref:CDGSH-type Zn-finger protein n=1 Tax=Microlunatus kandeliicorticis TaxID=1759536 RepID=A0A7W3ITP3_9ACTN|nr:CDGSH iron-sulfur domain-containing protein [Microlunatus kandeliicorticis]MBA8795034.1 CDGSH-type Zn-finger protein [Microlunatus kandeliicorticis]